MLFPQQHTELSCLQQACRNQGNPKEFPAYPVNQMIFGNRSSDRQEQKAIKDTVSEAEIPFQKSIHIPADPQAVTDKAVIIEQKGDSEQGQSQQNRPDHRNFPPEKTIEENTSDYAGLKIPHTASGVKNNLPEKQSKNVGDFLSLVEQVGNIHDISQGFKDDQRRQHPEDIPAAFRARASFLDILIEKKTRCYKEKGDRSPDQDRVDLSPVSARNIREQPGMTGDYTYTEKQFCDIYRVIILLIIIHGHISPIRIF